MGMLPMREVLPDRRQSWTQHVHIGGQSLYLTVGEYSDGRPGEIWIDVAKAGTFLRGVMGTLARSASIALQCGADVETIIHMLREHDYPPNGPVIGSPNVTECFSVPDWIASELESHYLPERRQQHNGATEVMEGDVPPTIPEKIAGDFTRGSGV